MKIINLNLLPREGVAASRAGEGLALSIAPSGGCIDVENLPDLTGMRYLVLDITTYADMHLPIEIRFFKRGAEESSITITTSSIPGVRAIMPFDFAWFDNRQIFKARTPGRFKTTVFGEATDISDVASVKLYARPSQTGAKIVVRGAYVTDEMPDVTLRDPKPVVDEFGQVAARDWPGKTRDAAEMADRLKALYAKALESRQLGMPYPERFGYSRWGGDKNKRLTRGSGYFAVHREGGAWYLADPDGYAFFSVGTDCVGTNTASLLTGIEKLYADMPDRAQYAAAYNKSAGYFDGGEAEFIDYYRVNMMRVFGGEWLDAYCAITEYLLKEMGFNTIGNWSDPDIIAGTRMPYVIPLNNFPSTERLIFRDFPDVFSGEYAKNSAAYAEQLGDYAGDARLIGYFMRNEPQWGFSEDICLAREMFRSNEPFESKRELWRYLTGVYGGAEAVSRAWGVEMGCETCLLGLTLGDLPADGACAADLKAFSQKMVEHYVSVPAKALRAADPNHLNLGMRYAFLSSDAMFMGTELIDVFSINCYRDKPRERDVQNILERCGRPCMIGEYHHGANDRGCFGNALRAAASSAERGVAYRYYTEQSAAMPSMLGCHYFCIGDEAALGRYDGECWILGFVDVCHRPYEEMFDAAVKTHERIYAVKAGLIAPFDTPAAEIPSNSY